jgi:hypothetical protein
MFNAANEAPWVQEPFATSSIVVGVLRSFYSKQLHESTA